ncbi:zinc finger BED domain-containing protein RICESLEEPER 3-like isoform X2 [Primulina tabacum]|uniref:zinc finger BED domain-containing protein RICESLEEPER 3-like isoform X2 n=1 Tax=Primulina tabacum TaxID=48773 RepID=UPI003F5A06BF
MESNDKEGETAPTVGSQELASKNESVLIEENEITQNENLDAEIMGADSGNKRKFISPAWDHFERKLIGGKWKAICNNCKKSLGGESKNGTRHLLDHIKTCLHKKQKTIKQSLLQPTKSNDERMMLGTYHFNQDHGREELANMIILHEYPLSMVDHVGFRRFIYVPCSHTAEVLANSLVDCLLDWNLDHNVVNTMATNMKLKFEKYWEMMN